MELRHSCLIVTDSRNTWNVIYIARSNRSHPPTPNVKYCSSDMKCPVQLRSISSHPPTPNFAPVTQNDPHDWSSSHMKRPGRSNRSHPPKSPNIAPDANNDPHDLSSSHMKRPVQCAEQQGSPSNTKYCPCHEKWLSWLMLKHDMSSAMCRASEVILQHQILHDIRDFFWENDWNVIYNAGAIQTWSGMIRAWSDLEPVSPQPAAELRLLFALTTCILYLKCNMSRSRYHSTFHQVLPLPRKVTVELHQILHLPGRLNVQLECNFIKHCACHEKWQLNCTKYCTCPENWACNLSATSSNIGLPRKFYCSLTLQFFDSAISFVYQKGRGFTCTHEMRSLVHNAHLSTSDLTCTHGIGSLVHMHGFMGRETYSSTGGVGGVVNDNVPWTCTHTSLRLGWVGWVGW